MLTGGRRFELNIKNALTRVVVSVFREGARETLTDITVEYSNDAPQAMWGSFLRRVSEALDLPTLDGIYTENEGYYVARITSLINGARYLVRPTENSALTRSLTIDKAGHYPAWDVVDRGRAARATLANAIDVHERSAGPLPQIDDTVSMPWIVELEENVETAAQVRAIAAAKVSKGVAAREAERRTRKAKRAGGRVDAAVQHIISPDSVEGMFQAMAFLRKQEATDLAAAAEPGAASGELVGSGRHTLDQDTVALLALRGLSRFARAMPTDQFIEAGGVDRSFELRNFLLAQSSTLADSAIAAKRAATVAAYTASREVERAQAAAAAAAAVQAPFSSTRGTTTKSGSNVSGRSGRRRGSGRPGADGPTAGASAIGSDADTPPPAVAAAAVANKEAAEAHKMATQAAARALDGSHWLVAVMLNVCNRPGDPPWLLAQAQDACAAQGGLDLVLAIIRDSGPSHPSGSGDSSGSGSGGGGQGGRATNEALAAAAKVLVVANPGSASKQSQSFGSPVATALQALHALIRNNRNLRLDALQKGALPLIVTKGMLYQSWPSVASTTDDEDNGSNIDRKGVGEAAAALRPKPTVPLRDSEAADKMAHELERATAAAAATTTVKSTKSKRYREGDTTASHSSGNAPAMNSRPTSSAPVPTPSDTDDVNWNHVVPLMAPPANSRTNWPVQLPPTVAKNALGGDKKALGRRVFDSPLIGRTGPELLIVSYALYTIWLLDELLADRLPPPIGSHKRTLAGGGIPLSKPSTAAAPATAPAVGKVSVPANSSSINGGTRNNRVLPRESGEIGEGAGARPERDSFAVKAATGMNDDENVNWPTWGPGSDWVLQEEESLTNLSSDDSFAAVAYCAAALADRCFFEERVVQASERLLAAMREAVCGSRYEEVVAAEAFAARSAESQAASQAGSAFHSSPGTARSGDNASGDNASHQDGTNGNGNGNGGRSSSTVAAAAAALLQTAAVDVRDTAAGAHQGTVTFKDNGIFGDTFAVSDNTIPDFGRNAADETNLERDDVATSDGTSSSSSSGSSDSAGGASSEMAPAIEVNVAPSSEVVLTPEEVEAKALATRAATAAAVAAAPLKAVPLVVLEPWQQRLQAIDNAIKIGRANGFIQG